MYDIWKRCRAFGARHTFSSRMMGLPGVLDNVSRMGLVQVRDAECDKIREAVRMNNSRRLLLIACMVVCMFALLPTVQAAQGVPPGSYLEAPVNTIEELCTQIQENPIVAARFSKHFGIPASEVVSYLTDYGRMKHLTVAARYTEYYVDVRGRMVSHVKFLPVGTPVVVMSDGTPVMDMRCGNPMYKSLPRPVAKAKPVVTQVAQSVQETPPPPPVVPPIVEAPPPPPAPVEPVTQVLGAAPQEISFSPAAMGAGVLALLPLLGAGAVTGSGNINVVPEPSGMIALLTGAVALVGMIRRRR